MFARLTKSICRTEHRSQAAKRDADRKLPALVRSNAALAGPARIPGLNYIEIRLAGRKLDRFLAGRLSWCSFL